jgi:hypothetical protein
MLKQEEVAFFKALTNVKLSPVFLRELKKAIAAGKKQRALAASQATSAAALQRPDGEDRAFRDSLSKRKAEVLNSSDCPSEPASRRPAPGHLFVDGPESQGTTGELAALGSRQLDSTEGGLVHAEMAAGAASLQQPSGPHKSTAKGAEHSAPAASSEADTRRMPSGTCPDRCVACQLAPLHTPKRPLTVPPLHLSGTTRPLFITAQGSRTRAAS